MPAVREFARRRAERLGIDPLRPWDLSVDPEGLPPLEPFKTADELVRGGRAIFDRVDAELGEQFGRIDRFGLLDLENRKGKAPGGYQATLDEHRLPFIFMNAVGQDSDLRTLLHEAGHAFHTFAAREEPMREYRSPGHEFAEVASMSMELLANRYLTEFYNEADARRSRRRHLEGTLDLLPWIATIDAFQHWLYTHEGHTRGQRRDYWLTLRERFGNVADWTGYEEENAYLWLRQGHLFGSPFYYIEYGIAQLGALGVWRNAKTDPVEALAAYRRSLALGGSVALPQLFEAANLKFDFGPKTVGPLVDAVMEAIDAEAG
jgi:oligoendopeptidase F